MQAGFEIPNTTPVPNQFFEAIKDMGAAEMAVTMIMIRETYGFQRDRFKMSLTELANETGLSRQGALDGAKAAEDRGSFRRVNKESAGSAEWELVVQAPLNTVEGGIQPVEGSPQPARGVKQPVFKELKKKNLNKHAPDGASEPLPPAPTKPGVTGWPTDVRELAVVFAMKFGRDPYPFEKAHWIKSIRTKYHVAQVTVAELERCYDMAAADKVKIKSPDSILYNLDQVRATGQPIPVELGVNAEGAKISRVGNIFVREYGG